MTILASPRLVAQKPFHLGICKSLKNHQRNRLRWTAQNHCFWASADAVPLIFLARCTYVNASDWHEPYR